MNFHGKGLYQWDTWYCKKKDTEEVHAFYLQQLRPDSTRSQLEADSIGHAVSYNLIDWKELPVALIPEEPGKPGDLTSWTGSTIEYDEKYYMFYTIRSSADGGKIQMIGLAVSKDLMNWEKYKGNPIITPDPRWYNTIDNKGLNDIVDCRDLMVVKHNSRPGFFGVYATRIPTGELPEGSVFAGAYSEDMVNWEQTPPVFQSAKDEYSIVEMPDLFEFEGKWYLTWLEDTSYGNREILGDMFLTCGTIYAVSDKVEGPYIAPEDNILIASMGFNGISCRTVDFKGKKYVLYTMGERMNENELKHTMGVLALPKEVRVVDGKLCACFAELINEKLGEVLIDLRKLPKKANFQNCHETPGQWVCEGNSVRGGVRTAWSRYTFEASGDNFIYSADIEVKSGVAAGLLIRQPDNKSGCVALLDFKRQAILCCTVPRFQIMDMRKISLVYGQKYNMKVIGNGKFIEVYIDEVLYLQFVSYFNSEGLFGLLLDRAEGSFERISAQSLIE
jgi:sucrose-6-phosphate hydrolase SacC (GH32 family)